MMRPRRVGPEFREGDEVVLAKGTYQGTHGFFLRLRDVTWADITERNGSSRSHPLVWLYHCHGAGFEVPRTDAGYRMCRSFQASIDDTRSRTTRQATMQFEVKSQMNGFMSRDIEAWDGEGGAAAAPLRVSARSMSGTAAQVEWAERIKRQVNAEFDRVAASFRSVAGKQDDDKRRYGSRYRDPRRQARPSNEQ
jgi:hypothetical protein